MLNLDNDRADQIHQTLVHDINSSLSALLGAIEVMKDEWRENPELVERILPLTKEKIQALDSQLQAYRRKH